MHWFTHKKVCKKLQEQREKQEAESAKLRMEQSKGTSSLKKMQCFQNLSYTDFVIWLHAKCGSAFGPNPLSSPPLSLFQRKVKPYRRPQRTCRSSQCRTIMRRNLQNLHQKFQTPPPSQLLTTEQHLTVSHLINKTSTQTEKRWQPHWNELTGEKNLYLFSEDCQKVSFFFSFISCCQRRCVWQREELLVIC